MITVLHMVIDIVFFTAMIFLFSKRLDELEDWQSEVDERLSDVEFLEEENRKDIAELFEQVEKCAKPEDKS